MKNLVLTFVTVALVFSSGCVNSTVLSSNAASIGTGGADASPSTTPFRAVPAKDGALMRENETLKKALIELQNENRRLEFKQVDVYPVEE